MKGKKTKSSKTLEFLTLFLMVIGTTVGAGIYFKNQEIAEQTGNPIIGIILWAIVGIVCVMSIIVFIEISSSTKNVGNGTIGNWTKLFVSRKLASFFSLLYMIVYAPALYAFFIGSFIYFLFMAIGVEISASTQLIIYLVCGIAMICIFSVLNGLKPKWSKGIQVFGTAFKFIPLIVAFIAGFCLISKSGPNQTAMWNTGDGNATWSMDNWKGTGFIRGFGGILLAFDGYIYLANAQKDAVHKEVVPKALLTGLIFVAVFYTLMAVSLFLGSKDGSVVSLFQRLFGGGNASSRAGTIVSYVIVMIICIVNMNVMSMVATMQIESDAVAKILYTGANRTVVSKFKAAIVSAVVTIVVYVVFILMGFFIKISDSHGVKVSGWSAANGVDPITGLNVVTGNAITFINIMASVGAIFSFSMVGVLIFAAFVNRFTKKVKVDKRKGMPVFAIISGVLITAFVILGIYTFLDPRNGDYSKVSWSTTSALPFLILLVVMIAVTLIAFGIQELLFKLYPFEDGFAGELTDADPRPYIFKFNPIKNYYTKVGTAEVQAYQERIKNEKKIN